MPKIWFTTSFSKKKIVLANLKCINSYNMMKKKLVLLYNFGSYFFPFNEVNGSFSNLLTTANNNFIKPKVDFFSKEITWHSPLARRISPEKGDFMV